MSSNLTASTTTVPIDPSPLLAPSALAGLRVVERGQLLAGPCAAKTLADFGAGIVSELTLTPGLLRTPAPPLGDDTDRVLDEIGLSAAQIEQLRARGIVA